MPVYPVVARAAFLIFFSSTTGPVFLALAGPDGAPFREPEASPPFRNLVDAALPRPVAGREAVLDFRASSAFISLRSFILSPGPTVLWWILHRTSRCSEFALARAIISANDRFFGGAELAGAGRLATEGEGSDFPPSADDGPGFRLGGSGFCLGAGLLIGVAIVGVALSTEPAIGLSLGRGDGFDRLPFDRDDVSTVNWVRAALVPAMRSSSSAFRLGSGALARDSGFGDGVGFSPVIDASRSRICRNQSASNAAWGKCIAAYRHLDYSPLGQTPGLML